MDSVIYQIPAKKWRWEFSCRHKQSVADWRGRGLSSGPGGVEGGWAGGEDRIRESGMGGKEGEM